MSSQAESKVEVSSTVADPESETQKAEESTKQIHRLNLSAAPFTPSCFLLATSPSYVDPCIPKPFTFNPHAAPFVPRPRESQDAKFFVVKTRSSEDVQKSIQTNRWRSFGNGRKKLATSYTENSKVFLLFSVIGSGRFCGAAELNGPYDNDAVYFCDGEVWRGSFPVIWNIIKDVPNRRFSHIVLDDNEPVTRSRDMQEVTPKSGYEMLSIFKNHQSEEGNGSTSFQHKDSDFPILTRKLKLKTPAVGSNG